MHIIYFTEAGRELAQKILTTKTDKIDANAQKGSVDDGTIIQRDEASSDDTITCGRGVAAEWTKQHFHEGNVLVYIGACGIAVRLIAPLIRDKAHDPAVIVADEKGQFVIPLLSGHIGGANEYAAQIAEAIGGTAVITTATDVNQLFAVDVFARRNGLIIDNMTAAKRFSAQLLEAQHAQIRIPAALKGLTSIEGEVPRELQVSFENADNGKRHQIIPTAEITPFRQTKKAGAAPASQNTDAPLILIPRCIVAGIGCRKGKSAEELHAFLRICMESLHLRMESLHAIASIDIKRTEEGMVRLAERLGVSFLTFSAEVLEGIEGLFAESETVRRTVGTGSVCERSAAAAGAVRLLKRKTAWNGMTVCIGILPLRIGFDE